MLTERTFPDRPCLGATDLSLWKNVHLKVPIWRSNNCALQLINIDTQWCTILGSCLSERDIDQHRFAPTCAIYPLNLVSGQTWELWRAATCRLSCATSWVWEQTAANAFHIDVSIWVWFQHVSTWVSQNGIFSLWQLATQSGSLWARTNISWFVAVGCAPSLLSAVDSARFAHLCHRRGQRIRAMHHRGWKNAGQRWPLKVVSSRRSMSIVFGTLQYQSIPALNMC